MKLIRSVPGKNNFFQEELLECGNVRNTIERNVVNIYDDVTYQEIEGFGGAFTESSAYLYAQLTPQQKADFMDKYFTRDKGIGYNYGRTHINSCDFALDIYTYVQDGDQGLSTFTLERDRKYIIPFLKDALTRCSGITLYSSPWSPPAYMKENESPIRGGALKEEYKALWAAYYARYIQEMEKEGITISAVSVQNEPNARQPWESCSYSPEQEREFVEKFLAPALDQAGLSHIKIIVWDHNKERVYDRARTLFESEAVRNRVWAVGHHWYSGDHFEGPRLVHEQFGKTLISSEICSPINADPIAAAEDYGREICEDLNNFTAVFCDWNLLLSEQGGPFHNRTESTVAVEGKVFEDKSRGCYAPVLYDTQKKELIYTPIYYYIGHFSKYILPGAVRVATTKHNYRMHVSAFRNPDGSLVLVAMNPTDNALPMVIRHRDVCTRTDLPAHSICTVLI